LGYEPEEKRKRGTYLRQERKLGKKKARKFEDGEIRIEGEKTKTLGSGEFQIPQWEFRGQSPLTGRHSAEDRTLT
jgi:hypothetical protein